MESINNDYSPSACATEVMPSATSQQSLINTYRSCKRNKTITQELDTESIEKENIKMPVCGLVSTQTWPFFPG